MQSQVTDLKVFRHWFDKYLSDCPQDMGHGHRWVDKQWIAEAKVWTERCEKCGWRRVTTASEGVAIFYETGGLVADFKFERPDGRLVGRNLVKVWTEYRKKVHV